MALLGWVKVCDIAPMLTYTHQAQVGVENPLNLGPLGFVPKQVMERAHGSHGYFFCIASGWNPAGRLATRDPGPRPG